MALHSIVLRDLKMSSNVLSMQASSGQTASCSEKKTPATLIPGYELLEVIGEGGFSLVYRALQKSTGQIVAVKVLRLSDAHEYKRSRQRFEREICLCAGLHHPNIVKLLDKGETSDQRLFAIFEYVPGQTLRQHIKNEGAMTALDAGHIMAQVLDALVCAHKQGIVHRDLKPQNIMVTTTGVNAQVKILDFGIGTIVSQSRPADFLNLTQIQESLGTPSYSSPEQLRGDPATVQTDLYAWGLVFLECLIGAPVMQGASAAEIYHRQLSAQEVPIPSAIIDHPLAGILRRVLKKKPTERCTDGESLWRELRAVNLSDIVGQIQSQSDQSQLNQCLSVNEATVVNSGAFLEKRQITVLCCSVSLMPSSNNDETKDSEIEALEILQQDQFNQCRDIATRFGGELAGCLADRMLVYFGYPHASDTDARRAARTALEITRVMKRRALQLEAQDNLQLHIRSGIHTGLMIVKRDETPQGYVANIAMRLESEAQTGDILVSEASFKCLERHITFEKDQWRSLSGNCLSMQTWRLMGQRHVDAHHFLSVRSTEYPFVGNHHQLQWLEQKWDSVAGQLVNKNEVQHTENVSRLNQGVLILGEAGIGKSRLLKELFSVVHDQGHHVYLCRCLPEHKNNGLFPFLELIKQSLEISELTPSSIALDRLETEFSRAGCNIEKVLPIICAWLSLPVDRYPAVKVSPQRQKAWLLQAIADWLIYLSKDQALLLVVEDLHWIDPTSLELLQKIFQQLSLYTSRGGQSKALLPVMTARPEIASVLNLAPDNDWGEKLEILQMNRLDRGGIEELIDKLAVNKKLHPAVIEKIVSSTDGVPLFVEELTHMLLDNHLVELNGTWQLKNTSDLSEIPLTLRDLLIGRLDSLASVKETAQVAASIGREFDYELLVSIGVKTREELTSDIAVLVKSGLVYRLNQGEKNIYAFRHSLIREAAYEAMLIDARQQIHNQIALALSVDFPDRLKTHPEEIAWHYSCGGRPEKSCEYFIKAARLSASTFSNHEALNLYARAIGDINEVVHPDSGSAQNRLYTQAIIDTVQGFSGEAYEGLGDSAGLVGDHLRARQAYNDALNANLYRKTQCNNETRARVLRKMAKSWEVSHQHEKSLLLYQQSERSLGEFSTVIEDSNLLSEWLKIHSGKLYVNYWDNNNVAMEKILDTVQPVVKEKGNKRQQAAVILDELLCTYREMRYRLNDKTVGRAYELVGTASECEDPELMAQAQHELGLCLLFGRRYEKARAVLESAVKLSEEIDDSVLQCRNLTYLAVAYRMLGQVDEVERIARASLEMADRMVMTDYTGAANANLAWVAWKSRDYTEASRLATRAVELWHGLGNRYPYPCQWLGLLVLLAMQPCKGEGINDGAPKKKIMEYIRAILNINQQILPVNINQSLIDVLNKGEESNVSLKNVVNTAKCEGLL